jgi:small conductance mechanosensitive channel
MFAYLLAVRWGIFQEGRFLGKILDEWTNDAQEFVHSKLPHLIVVLVIAFILIRLLSLVTSRMIRVAEAHATGGIRLGQVKTLSTVIRATGLTIIAVITGLQFLDAVGLNLGPLLASAGIAGVAIGLAAQTIVKDVLNGILIILEDQFNVGDKVKIAGLAGTIEAMTLRKTTVRDDDGTLYVIPNSQITTVANLSSGYSVATVSVSVDFSANPDEVQQLLTSIAMDIRNSKEFKDVFITDPQILGVDAIKGSELIFPVVFKTLANQQYGPIREFRRRVRLALEEHSFLPGNPYRVVNAFQERGAAQPGLATAGKATAPDPTTIKPEETNPFTSTT